jgi:hypothetical protein
MSAGAMRDCWNCGKKTPRAERYCAECGADAWNPPQERNASSHSWRTNDDERPASTSTSWDALTAAGVLIIATILLMSFWFSVVLAVISVFADDEVFVLGNVTYVEAVVTTGRAIVALATASILTALSWAVALCVAESK